MQSLKLNEHLAKRRAGYTEGARRYAAANVSDPFAFARAMTHINNGIVGNVPIDGREPAIYDARAHTEMRKLAPGNSLSNGDTEFPVTVYSGMVRP